MELHALILSLLLLTIVSDSNARSVDTTLQCATNCVEPDFYGFEEGYTYQYQYTANVGNSIKTGSPLGSDIDMTTTVKIQAITGCELVMDLSQTSLNDHNLDATEWISSLEENPLHFSFQAGRIDTMCNSVDDQEWVLNLKRGILSTLQVTTNRNLPMVTETDVSGKCEYSYSTSENEITKTKDFNKCEDREKHLLFSHFTPYSNESPRQSFVHSEQSCVATMLGNELRQMICNEEHVFRPFSDEESGAKTVIRQSIVFQFKSRTSSLPTLTNSNSERSTLVFVNEEQTITSTDISGMQNLLSEVCTLMDRENYKLVSESFIKMVFMMRQLDTSAIEQVHSTLDGACPKWESAIKEMFLDAMQWCGSESCVVFSTQLIAMDAEELNDAMASRWISGMSLITKPTLPMLEGLKNIIESGRFPDIEKTYLTAGTLVNRICSNGVFDCMAEPLVRQTLKIFENKLGFNCRTTNLDRKQEILMSLRAIGNAGRVSELNTIEQCALEVDNDMETRIAAVKTFRRMPCANTDRSSLSAITFNTEYDAEIRIEAYQAAMQCPTPQFIKQITALLDNEPVLQVASFIWTHLTQLLESTDPLKAYIKPLLLETEFAKPYDLSPRKYSKFYEASLYSEQLNAGATVASSLVWSPKSFVPRSGTLDLTVDIFGQAVNLFEIGGRVEGVEQLLQEFLGPKGYLKKNGFSDLFMTSQDEEGNEEDEEVDATRLTRSTDNSHLVELRNQYKSGLEPKAKPGASWFMRLFGNEMIYANTMGMKPLLAEDNAINVVPLLTKLAQGGEYNYHEDTMLMNSAHVLPTGVGLPLTIAFNGSASIDLTASGKLDMTGLFTPERNLDLNAHINPRAVVFVTGSMSVDARITKVGIATESSALTSWKLGGTASIVNGESVRVSVDSPYDRNTVITVNHKLMTLSGDELTDVAENQVEEMLQGCSEEVIGQKLCLNSNFNEITIFPINGPISASIFFLKEDPGFTSYVLEGQYSTTYDGINDLPQTFSSSISIDTPGSAVPRQNRIQISYSQIDKTFDVTYNQASNVYSLNGALEESINRKNVMISYNNNGGVSRFEATIEKEYQGTEHQLTISSSLTTPSKTISGELVGSLTPSERASVQLTVTNLLASPISISMSLEDQSAGSRHHLRYAGEGQVEIPSFVSNEFRFDMNVRPQSDVFILGMNYQFAGMDEERIHFSHKRRDRSTATVTDWEASQKLTWTQYTAINHDVELAYKNGETETSSFAKFAYGRHAGHKDNTKYVSCNQTFHYSIDDESVQLNGFLGVQMPSYDIEYSGELSHAQDPNSMTTNLNLGSYGFSFSVQDNTPMNGLINKQLSLEVPTPWGIMNIRDSIEETSSDIYHLEGNFKLGNSRGLSLNSVVDIENLSGHKSFNIEVTGGNSESLLSGSSVLDLRQGGSLTFNNHMVSRFNEMIRFNLEHAGGNDGGFLTTGLFEHVPDKRFVVTVDFKNLPSITSRMVRGEFKDPNGVIRFIQLEASKTAQLIRSSATKTSVSAAFTTSIPSIPVKSVITEGESTITISSTELSGHITADDRELLGTSFTYNYDVQSEDSSNTQFSAEIRQGITLISTAAPTQLGLSGSAHNTLDDGNQVSLTFSKNQIEILDMNFNVAGDSNSITGTGTQRLSAAAPEEFEFTITKSDSQIRIETTFDRETLTVQLEKASNSITGTLQHSSRQLLKLGMPRSIETTMLMGRKYSDSGEGFWLDSTIDGAPLNAKMTYQHDSDHILKASLSHSVASLESLPQISATISASDFSTIGQISTSLVVDGQTTNSMNLEWKPYHVGFTYNHKCQYMDSLSIPRSIEVEAAGQMEPSIHLSGSLVLNDKSALLDVLVDYTSYSLTFDHSCNFHTPMNDHIELGLLPDQSGIKLLVRHNGATKNARISYGFENSKSIINLMGSMEQTLYVDEECPYIPTSVSFNAGYKNKEKMMRKEFSFDANYNGFSIDTSSKFAFREDPTVLVVDASLQQNLFNAIPEVRTHTEFEIQPFVYASLSTQYTLASQPQVSLFTSLGYEKIVNADVVSFALRQNQPELLEMQIPDDFKAVASLTMTENEIVWSLVGTVNQNIQKMSIGMSFDKVESTVRVSMSHDINCLHDAGVYGIVIAHLHAVPTTQGNANGFQFTSSVQLDDETYRVGGSADYSIDTDASRIVLNLNMNQDIALLDEYKIPRVVAYVTTIEYGLLDLSGQSSIVSTLTRTMHNQETGETTDIENHITLGMNLQLFNWNAEIYGSHDFDVENIPRNIAYHFIASGSSEMSKIFYKSIMMSMTIDGKNQVATISVNRNPADRSFFLATTHNVTQLYQYGIPGNMSINFRRRSAFDADLSIEYDTAMKSIGIKFDYLGEKNKIVLYFNHNFDVVVEKLYLPKSIGFETWSTISERDTEFDLKTVWGPYTNTANLFSRYDLQSGMLIPTISYKLKQNYTSNDIFPQDSRFVLQSTYGNGFSVRLSSERKYVSVTGNWFLEDNFDGTIRLEQNVYREEYPRITSLEVIASKVGELGGQIDATLNLDRAEKLHTILTGSLYKEQKSGSFRVETTQNFVDTEIFPTHTNMLVDGSVNMEFDTSIRLTSDELTLFSAALDTGFDAETQIAHVQLDHSQQDWISVGIPAHGRIEVQYTGEENMYSVASTVTRGRRVNHANIATSFIKSDDAVSVSVSYSQDFNELEDVARTGSASVFLQKSDTSMSALANGTYGEIIFSHAITAVYNIQETEFDLRLEATQDNPYLNDLQVPHQVAVAVSADWRDGISGSIRTDYGDKFTLLRIKKGNSEEDSYIMFSHNWPMKPKEINFNFSEAQDARLAITIDGESKDIVLSGNRDGNSGEIHFSHGFEGTVIPQNVQLSGTYSTSPDMHVLLTADVDGQHHTIEAGLTKLDDGIHITTTLTDDVTRTATFRKTFTDGGFNLGLEHSIPELQKYLPGSLEASGRISSSPIPTISGSFRNQQNTQTISAEADLEQLAFTFTHDFDVLPLPKSVQLSFTGSRSPMEGSMTLQIDQVTRSLSGTIDPQNLIATLSNNIPELPLPNSLRIEASGAVSPPSGRLSVTVNGIERSVSIETRFTNKLAELRVQQDGLGDELMGLFVPGNFIVRAECNEDQTGGELYLSIDGLERRVGGSVNPRRGIASFFQSAPEFEYIPRNITLAIETNTEPLSGTITLTIDEVERQIHSQVDQRSLFAAITHSVPEVEPFIPRHMSISGTFRKESPTTITTFSGITVSFTKDNAENHVSINLDLGKNSVHLTVAQNVATAENFPNHIDVLLSGDIESKNVSIQVGVDDVFVQLGGEVYIGSNDGWYGATATVQQNLSEMLTNCEIMIKVRESDKSYELNSIINLSGVVDYSAALSVTPSTTSKRKALIWSYNHHLDGEDREITGVLKAMSRSGVDTLIFDVNQSSPVKQRTRLEMGSQVKSLTDIILTLETQQNIKFLLNNNIPRTIESGRLQFNADEEHFNIVSSAIVDKKTEERELNVQWNFDNEIYTLTAEYTGDRAYSGAIHIPTTPSEGTVEVSYEVRDSIESPQPELSQSVSVNYVFNIDSPRLTLNVHQNNLNGFGVPTTSTLSFSQSENGNLNTYVVRLLLDDSTSEISLKYNFEDSITMIGSFTNDIDMLTQLSVPSFVEFSYDFNNKHGQNIDTQVFTATIGGKYNQYQVDYEIFESLNTHSGRLSQTFSHNIPEFREMIGYNSIVESYTYTYIDGELFLNGTVNKDNNVHIGDYQLSIHRDGTFHYSNIYDNKGYISDFVIGNENDEFIFTFNLKDTEAHTIFAINVDAGDNFRYGSKITINDVDYAFTTSIEDYSVSGLTGKTLQIAYSVDKVPCSVTVTLAADQAGTEGKMEMNFINKKIVSFLPRRSRVSMTMDPTQFNIDISCGKKRYLMSGNYNIVDETITMSFSNSYSNIGALEMLKIPAEISATGTFSMDNSQATISADEIDLLRLSVRSGVFSLVSRDLTNAVVLRASGNYIFNAQKSIDARIICSPLNIDVSTSQSVVMFERNTGNSSFVFSFTDNNSHNQFDLTAFAYPTSTHAADFIMAFEATSTYTMMPFVLKLKFDSDYDVEQNIYDHEFTSTLNSENLHISGHYTPTMFTTTSTYTKSGRPSVTTLSGSEEIDQTTGRKNSIVRLQWDEPKDSVEISTSGKSAGLNSYYSIHVIQPSKMFAVGSWSMICETDTTSDYKMNFNIQVDEDILGVNTTYAGVLPQYFGKHDLTVNIKQPIFNTIPSEFETKGVMKISSEGLYMSDWRITSNNKELVVLKKNFIPRDEGYELDILWQQSIETTAFRYFKLMSSGSASETNIHGQGSVQLDNMPVLKGSINIGTLQNNQSLDLSISTGPLAPWVNVRELKTSGWYKSTPKSRKITPEFSITVDVDDKVYHVDTVMTYGANSRSAKYTHAINFLHPLNLVLFGMKVPQEHNLGFSSMNRASSCRIVFDYNNERIEHPFKLVQLMRWNNGDTDLEATTNIKFTSASNDDITMNLIKEDKLTIRLQYPEVGIDGDVVIGAISNANTLNFNVLAKSYASEEQKSWKFDITFNKDSKIIELNIDAPEIEEITLQGDLSEVFAQVSQLMKRLAADATHTELQFTYGMNALSDGYDLYIGYHASDGLPYTLHMAVGMDDTNAYAALQTKIDFELDVEIARIDVDLVESRLIQLKLTASPAITKFFKGAISKTEMEFARKVTWVSANLVQFLEALKTTISGSENVQAISTNMLDSVIEKVQAVKDLSINFVTRNSVSATSRIQIFESMIESHVRNALVYVLDSIDRLKNIVLQPFTKLRDEYYGPIIQQLRAQLAITVKPITDQLNKIQAGQLFLDVLEEAIQKTVKFITMNGESALSTARSPLSDLLIVTGNEIIFNIPLEFDVEHFTPLPTLQDVKTWLAQSALAIYVDDIVQTMYSYTKQYYRVRSLVYMPRDELLPPFKGHAFVSGFRHFSTFDNKHFDFQSSCASSHVLATDGRGGNFTVAITYADPSTRHSQDAIEVFVANRHVKVNRDYTIESNGRTKELPLELSVMAVTLEGNVVHVRDADNQLDVACDFTRDLCTLDISPYYFSSTAGLNGIFNNEPSDDFTGPDHQLLATPAEMASAWDISASACSSSNLYSSCADDSATCFALFEDTSSQFRSCFTLVDPAPYMKMCKDDMCNSEDSAKACAASAAYAYKCRLAGAPLMLPDQCIVCSDVSGHHFSAGRTRTATTSGTDIVVVLEEGSCMRRSEMYRTMRKLIKRFDGTLSDAHMKNNRYTLVGYGGPGGNYAPHTITMRGHSSTKKKSDFLKAFRKININSDVETSDSLEAISYASQLPFRMGSKPIILLLSCDECSADSKVSYNEVQYQLKKQGITFHHAPKTHISTGLRKMVYGYDESTAMLKNTGMSSAIIKQSKSDVCVPLATGNGGSVWDATLVNESDFAGKLGNFIAQKSSTPVQQSCRCELNDLGIATSVCTTLP